MNVREKSVQVLLTEEGYESLQVAVPGLPESRVAAFSVKETDEMGMWVRIARPDGDHILLVRWEFVLTVDVPAEERGTRSPGFGN